MYDLEKVAKFIKTERAKAGLSQERLADISDVGIRTVIKLENNQKVKLTSIEKVAKTLGWEMDVLISFKKDNSPLH